MSSGFGELTIRANDLVAAGDLAGAQALLADPLAGADPRPGTASPELAEAAGLQARILIALGDPYAARGWAAFAHSATARLHGTADSRTVAAAATLAAVLHRVGSHDRAARLYQDVIIELTATDGPESLRVLAAHADLATVEYALGQCEVARTRLTEAWDLHREVYGDGHLSGIKMLARLGAMERDCGHLSLSHDHLALARELCRVHLATDHPLAIQVAALARAAPDPDHICSDPPPAGGPAARTAAPDTAPTVPSQRPSFDAASSGIAGTDDDPLFREPDDPGDDDRWWPPDGSAPPPDVPAFASGGGTLAITRYETEADGVHRVRHLPQRRQRPGLPAVYQPPRRVRLLPIIVVGAAVMALGAVAVVVGFRHVDGEPEPGPSVPADTTATASATPRASTSGAPAPGAPPTGLTLRDNRDNVRLAWTYPAGAAGPVVVSGGRAGQDPRAFQELPPGSDGYIVYGLNNRLNYCFTVSVVYSAEVVGRTKPVCTRRSAG